MAHESVLSDYVTNLEESATLKMSAMARALKAEGKDVISLSIGEPDFDTPKHICDAAKQALDNGYTHYTPVPGLIEFREAIVQKLKRDNGLNYDANQIVVSNGAKQSISNLCQAFINPGDEVIIFAPYWVSYKDIILLAGGKPIYVEATVENDFKVTAEQLAQVMHKDIKFVLFSSPCNPTGSVYTQAELKAIADVIAPYSNTYIISDEIYEYIVFGGEHHSIAQNANVFDRTIVVNGMSKGFAMTGWRLGYMAAPAPIAKACAKIQGQVTSGASAFGQMAAAHALTSDMSEVYAMRDTFHKRRELVLTELKKIEGLIVNEPQGAFYIFPDCSNFFGRSIDGEIINDSVALCEAILAKVHVAAVAGAAFGSPNCMRISYAASEAQLIEACRRLKSFFDGMR